MEDNITKQNKYFEHTKYIIDPNIHKFLYVLVKYFFFGKNNMNRTKDKLIKFIEKLKIKNLDKSILDNNSCNFNFFKAIFDYIKKQNKILASEIFENIIIRVLSFAFKTKKEDFFGKYLYNNLEEFKNNNNIFNDNDWINEDKLKGLFNDNNKDLKFALKNDNKLLISEDYNQIRNCKESTFLQILFYILKSKVIIDNTKEDSISNNKTGTSTIMGDNTSIYTQLSNFFYGDNIGKRKRDYPLPISSSILISSYIYHQNNISPFMKYSEKDKSGNNLEQLPFLFELSEAGINDIYINTILSPIRIEPRVCDIELDKNRINIYGIFELHKLLLFNKNIKKISIKSCETKSKSINTFNDYFKLFDNYNVEKLDISSNYLKSDADTNLSKLITHLKGLKSLVLSNNILKSGLGYFFVTLKNLYRKNESKLEELYLNNCDLDDISFYELGELLKSKYCKLKFLCLNDNKIPSDVNFFKALKKNKSLEEIYFYGCGINSEKTDEIERLISNANLQTLYLYTNQIHDFNQYIRIIYRNTLIKNKYENKDNINVPTLFNLNMNNIDCYNQNAEKLNILFEGIKRTNLTALDLSFVLKNINNIEHKMNFKYYKGVKKIFDYLSRRQINYKKALFEFELNKDKNNNLEDGDIKIFNQFDSYISNNILESNNLNFKDKVNELISHLNIENEKEKKEKSKKLLDYISSKIIKSKKMILI